VTRCLTCRKATAGRPENPWSPFCSERCKLVDLGKWLGEEYRVAPAPPQEGDEQEIANLDGTEDGDKLVH
jgi:endogenous inhibitor of DNA gyrase (YacG/DUF329 family)